ncbi:hypothetical protein PENANT_c106G00549 [Penicillium antarcticum]|uniref:Uncharacterized protein n=1 Tax=Penicillium antarcticum TaxID=416450 RepID=A0A1V6PKF8_9EURO|nr:hypothetical protein PENANT_c208G08054 [Penicillium antarcticum]OQD73769.1 hypothetical protein PENANT_c196G05847 [Penicillium antarcticum]OQD77363.1 hypothetical protein PENANT_c110G02555 [Penicillium antarcticum]OQD77404.1 hypothetical protein PENANT_c106G00549 [Penicillium antarcticum]
MPAISRQPMRRAGDELDAMPLLGRRSNKRPSQKTKGANSLAESKLQRDQPTLRLRLQQRCLKPETWWTSLTAFDAHDDVSEHMLEHEKAIATEETRQEWMRRLRPMPHRQNPPAKKGTEHKKC